MLISEPERPSLHQAWGDIRQRASRTHVSNYVITTVARPNQSVPCASKTIEEETQTSGPQFVGS